MNASERLALLIHSLLVEHTALLDAQRQERAHAIDDHTGLSWLRKIFNGTLFKAVELFREMDERAHNEHGQTRRHALIAQPVQDLPARDRPHHQIEDNEMRLIFRNDRSE